MKPPGDQHMSEVERLKEAIRCIWTAPVYQDGKRENGVSLHMVGAIRNAARAAGFIGEDRPLTPELAELEAELARVNERGIYPKFGASLSVADMITELRRL